MGPKTICQLLRPLCYGCGELLGQLPPTDARRLIVKKAILRAHRLVDFNAQDLQEPTNTNTSRTRGKLPGSSRSVAKRICAMPCV